MSRCARNRQNWRSLNLSPKLQSDASLRSEEGWPNAPEQVAGCYRNEWPNAPECAIIEKNLPEMLRAAMSIRAGTLSASTIARRLKKKNQLYYGFRELGKVVRTQFLMEYIGDGGLRRMINASTNKSESFNKFSDWLFFGNKGVIRENERHEQSKILKWNHLVSNMVIFHNVEAMGRTLKKLKHEGCEITEEILGHLSPYLQSANLLGDYRLDTSKQVRSLDFSIQPL